MIDFLNIMGLPFAACLILTGIHAYLGLHVIQRQVIFVDLALAQIAVLGASIGILIGCGLEHPFSYLFSLCFTILGAGLFALTRLHESRVPQEAIIGVIYVVASSLTLIILNFSGEGTVHIRQFLIGNILLVSQKEVLKILLIYSLIGALHYIFRHKFMSITADPRQAQQAGAKIKTWDFFFYATFGVVVTSSVQIAGVLLVFSLLVIPAIGAMLITDGIRNRLIMGWILGAFGSLCGMTASFCLDLPTGATVVCVLGIILLVLMLWKR